MFLFVGLILSVFGQAMSQPQPHSGVPLLFKIVVPLHLTMLETILLLIIYVRYLFKTDRVAQDKKTLWAVVLFLGSMIAMPVFWYLYMWRPANEAVAEQVAAAGPR
jgi:hypothetical protein